MKLVPSFDPDKQRIVIMLECNLLDKYYNLFASLVLDSPDLPKGTEVEQDNNGSAVVSFPMCDAEKKMTSTSPENENSVQRIAIDQRKVEELNRIINVFMNEALKSELSMTEFLPLNGYDEESLKKDVRQAVKNKRIFCILKDYSEYLERTSSREYKFHQIIIEPGSEEYADIAISIYAGELDALRKKYEPKLTLVDWC